MRAAADYTNAFKLSEKLVWPLALALGIFYLVFHVVSGEHGLYALLKEERKLEILQSRLGDIEAQRKELEGRVHRMSDKSLDRDMLDEQARAVLDDASQNEIVIPLK